METSNKSTGETLFDLTCYVVDTPANRSAKPEAVKEQTTQDTYSHGSWQRLADYDPATQSWRMFGDISLLEGQESLPNLPPSGMTQNGDLFRLQAWELRICENASSLWPTPTAVTRPMEGNVRMYRAKIHAGEMTEQEATAILGKSPWEPQGKLERWPTPVASDSYSHNLKSSQQTEGSRHSLNLPTAVGGALNPEWVEWLMGFPTGWTDLKDSETP